MPSPLSRLRYNFIESLNSANVEYLIVGGYAVAFHGHPRFTGDIDFFIAVNPQNAQAVVNAVELFGFADLGLDAYIDPEIVIWTHEPNKITTEATLSSAE